MQTIDSTKRKYGYMKKIYYTFLLFFLNFTLYANDISGDLSNHTIWLTGSYDPFTNAHFKLIKYFSNKTQKDIYITVNYNSGKNYESSIRERIEIMQKIFNENKNIKIIREPIQGRVEFAKKLYKLYDRPVLLGVGEDVFRDDYRVEGYTELLKLKNISFILFRRKGMETKSLPMPTYGHLFIEDSIDGTENISSTRTRKAIQKNKNTKKYLPIIVQQYIKEKSLYVINTKLNRELLFENFKKIIIKKFPNLTHLKKIPFQFKLTQSKEGQIDQMIRWVLINGKILKKDYAFYITSIEFLMKMRPLPISSSCMNKFQDLINNQN